MCGDGKQAYRNQGYEPRHPQELWDNSPMNPEKKKKKPDDSILEDSVR